MLPMKNLIFTILVLLQGPCVSAFLPQQQELFRAAAPTIINRSLQQPNLVTAPTKLQRESKLFFFDNWKRFFEDPLGNNDNNSNGEDSNNISNEQSDDDVAAGTFRVATIPVRSIKLGGLRLFIMFYLMGMQNTPDRGSWKADQPSTEEYLVDFYYADGTAILSVEMTKDQITIDRVGSTPSNSYLMQETTIVQGILDELNQCAFADNIDKENRLLVVKEDDSIEKAQEMLSFG